MFNTCGCPVHHSRTPISPESVTALFRLRDRPHKGGRCLERNLFTSQIFHSDKWLDKHESLKIQQLWQALKKNRYTGKALWSTSWQWALTEGLLPWDSSGAALNAAEVPSNFSSCVPVKCSSTGTENHCSSLAFCEAQGSYELTAAPTRALALVGRFGRKAMRKGQ